MPPVPFSQDLVPVIIHDDTVQRTTNGKGKIKAFNLKELQALDAGFRFQPLTSQSFPYRGRGIRIPTFEELLQKFPEQGLFIEIKEASEKLVHHVMYLVEKYKAQNRMIMTSKYHIVFKTMLKHYPLIPKAMSHLELRRLYVQHRMKSSAGRMHLPLAASMPLKAYGLTFDRQEWINFLKRQNIKTYFWTVNDAETALRLANMGVDGIITDRPRFIRQALDRPDGTDSKAV